MKLRFDVFIGVQKAIIVMVHPHPNALGAETHDFGGNFLFKNFIDACSFHSNSYQPFFMFSFGRRILAPLYQLIEREGRVYSMCDFFSFGCSLFQGGSIAIVISFPLAAINP